MKITILTESQNEYLQEMGIETRQEGEAELYFNKDRFEGFWVDYEDMMIFFYVGGTQFLCRHTKHIHALFLSLTGDV